eukprot:1137796-Pelagomonas_calceolata.AAC.7
MGMGLCCTYISSKSPTASCAENTAHIRFRGSSCAQGWSWGRMPPALAGVKMQSERQWNCEQIPYTPDSGGAAMRWRG